MIRNIGKVLEMGRSVEAKAASKQAREMIKNQAKSSFNSRGKPALNSLRAGSKAFNKNIATAAPKSMVGRQFTEKRASRAKQMMSSKRGRRVGSVAALAGLSVNGFASGFEEKDVSGDIYDLAFGNRDFVKEVTGQDLNFRQLMLPFPGERHAQNMTPTGMLGRTAGGTALGAGAGYTAGWGIASGLKLSGLRGAALKAGLTGVGAIAGTAKGAEAGFNNNAYKDAMRRKDRRKNQVDGSTVLGMYQARLG